MMTKNGEQLPTRKGKKRYPWNADAIRALRDHLGMTQRQMADELEVRQQTISEWETGFHTPHRSTQKTLTMVAERIGFAYEAGLEQGTSEDQAIAETQDQTAH